MWVGIQCPSSYPSWAIMINFFFEVRGKSIILLQVPFNLINLTQIKILDFVPCPSHRFSPWAQFCLHKATSSSALQFALERCDCCYSSIAGDIFYSVGLISYFISYFNFNDVIPSHLISNVSGLYFIVLLWLLNGFYPSYECLFLESNKEHRNALCVIVAEGTPNRLFELLYRYYRAKTLCRDIKQWWSLIYNNTQVLERLMMFGFEAILPLTLRRG
jgi:hypothetical protein